MAAANRAGTDAGGMDLALLTLGEADLAGSSGKRPVGKRAMAKPPKHHRASKKAFKDSELDAVRRQKAIDWEIEKALKRAECQRELPHMALDREASSHLFTLQPLEPLEDFDSWPELQWSSDGASEQLGASLPSNKEPLLILASQASQISSAWHQPVRHKPASIEATFTPMAAGIRAEQVPASMGGHNFGGHKKKA